MAITIEQRRVGGDGGVREGALIYRDDVLLAIFSRLIEEDVQDGGPPLGSWFLEAGLGSCGLIEHSDRPIFASLDEAAAWVEGGVALR